MNKEIPKRCLFALSKINRQLAEHEDAAANLKLIDKYEIKPDVNYALEFRETSLPNIVQRAIAHRGRTFAEFLYNPTHYERSLMKFFSIDVQELRRKFPRSSIEKKHLQPKSSRNYAYNLQVYRPYAKHSLDDFYKRLAVLEERAYFLYPKKIRKCFAEQDAANFTIIVYPYIYRDVSVVQLLWGAGENTERITGSKVYKKHFCVQKRTDLAKLDFYINFLCESGVLPPQLKAKSVQARFEIALKVVANKSYIRRMNNRVQVGKRPLFRTAKSEKSRQMYLQK